MDDNTLDTLIESISSFSLGTTDDKSITRQQPEKLTEENLNDYFLAKSKELIETGVNAVQDMAPYIVQGQNPDEIDALANLMTAATKALENLNKTTLIDKKADRAKEIKNIEIEGRKEIAQMNAKSNSITHNTNVLVASREEIMQKLFNSSKEPEVLEM